MATHSSLAPETNTASAHSEDKASTVVDMGNRVLGETLGAFITPPVETTHDKPKEVKLSPQSRMYLNDIVFALEQAGKTLVDSRGDSMGNVLVSGMSVSQYLKMLNEKIEDHQEYTYIMSVVQKMVRQIEEIDEHLAALDTMRPPGKHEKEQQDV